MTANSATTSWTHDNFDDDDDDDLIMMVTDVPEVPVSNRPQSTNTALPSGSIILPSDESDDDFAMLDLENQIEEERRVAESKRISNLSNERNNTASTRSSQEDRKLTERNQLHFPNQRNITPPARSLQEDRRMTETNKSPHAINERDTTNATQPLQEERRLAEVNQLSNERNTTVTASTSLRNSQSNIFSNDYEFKIESCSFVTIDELLNVNLEQLTGKCFVLKAEINNVFEKLQIKNCQFSIGVELNDGSTNQLKVSFKI